MCKYWSILVLLTLSLIMSACKIDTPSVPIKSTQTDEDISPSEDKTIEDEPQSLPFEIIEWADRNRDLDQKEHADSKPDMLVITSQAEIETVTLYLRE